LIIHAEAEDEPKKSAHRKMTSENRLGHQTTERQKRGKPRNRFAHKTLWANSNQRLTDTHPK
jgi:hypothetical protein